MKLVNSEKIYDYDYNTAFSCQYHVVFCTKYRRHVLTDVVSKRLRELILSKQKEYLFDIIEMEIMSNHVHMLISSNPKIGIYNQVTKIKGYTSNVLRKEFPELKSRIPSLWTRSKFISTVGDVNIETLKRYIEDQKNR